MVSEVDKIIYRSNPIFERELFFPRKTNIDVLVNHINLARKTIDLCIFSFKNDDLAIAIMYLLTQNLKVKIITDDESMKGIGSNA